MTKEIEVSETKLTNAELAELLDDSSLRMMRTDIGMQRLRALALEVSELRDTLNEHAKLHAVLNKVIHPKADGPEHPSLCDLIALVSADMKELEGNRAALEAKVSALNFTPGCVVVIRTEHLNHEAVNSINRVLTQTLPPNTQAIVCSPETDISTMPVSELKKIGLYPINQQPQNKSTH